jgi:uncharacterized protein YhbP (UPF0306 family)
VDWKKREGKQWSFAAIERMEVAAGENSLGFGKKIEYI